MAERRSSRLESSPGGMLSSSTLRLEGLQAEKVRFGIKAGEVGERGETAQDWVSLSVAFPCGRFVSKGSCDVEEERTIERVGHGAVQEGKARVSRENGMDHGMDTANAKCGRRPRVAAAWGLLWRNRHAPPKQLFSGRSRLYSGGTAGKASACPKARFC